MATIRKRGEKWQAQIRRRGQTQSRTFIQRADAQRWAKQTEIEADRKGLVTDFRSLERLTVSDVLSRFIATIIPNRRGRQNESIILNAFLRGPLAQVRLSDLTPDKMAAYRDQRLETVRPATINRELGLIQHVIEVAIREWNVPLAFNPVKTIRKPRADRPRERRLTGDEWERLESGCHACRNHHVLPLIRFARETGMRRGEMLNARWRDVNWTESTLRIPLTKNGEPRTIPLSTEAKAVLAALPNNQSLDAKLFPLTDRSIALAWKRLTKRTGIEDLHFHDLRHEAVSRFFERGLTVPEVALISGHKDPRMLFRYTHLRAEDVARKLNSIKEIQT